MPAWSRQLDGAVGVISCLGGFGTNDAMFKARLGSMVGGFCMRPVTAAGKHMRQCPNTQTFVGTVTDDTEDICHCDALFALSQVKGYWRQGLSRVLSKPERGDSIVITSSACMSVSSAPSTPVQICGDASVTVFREAASAGVARAAFVSVHDYKAPGGTNTLLCIVTQSQSVPSHSCGSV